MAHPISVIVRQNHSMKTCASLLTIACLAAIVSTAIPQGSARKSSLTGNIKHHANFHSKVLNNDRHVIVYLPPDYETNINRRYPVLYMHDGQNVFDGMTSYIPNQEWRADEAAESLISSGLIEPVIIVGIDNAGVERANEYLPTTMTRPDGTKWGGKADLYGKMLIEEIKPFIDQTYRTKKDRSNTALGGSSFGGVITLHLGLTRPDVFSKLLVVSPSLWWDHNLLIKKLEELKNKPNQKIWIDMGTAEGDSSVTSAKEAADALVKKGMSMGRDIALYIDSGAEHNEIAWARRFPSMLTFLFRKG